MLSLLHNVTALRKSSSSWKVLTVPWMVLLHIFSPVRIYYHHGVVVLLLLTLLLLRILLVVIACWISTGHWLAGTWAPISLRHHYSIDTIKLDLVLLIQSVEVQPALTARAQCRILLLRNWGLLLVLLVWKRLVRTWCLRVMLSTYLSSRKGWCLRNSLDPSIRIRISRAWLRFHYIRLQCYLCIDRLWWDSWMAALAWCLRILSFLLVNIRPPRHNLCRWLTWSGW